MIVPNRSSIYANSEFPQTRCFQHRRSLDYSSSRFNWTNPKLPKPLQRHSMSNSPLRSPNSANSSPAPKNTISIRRQSSEKCLFKQNSVDSSNSDPDYKTFLSPSQHRTSKSGHSSTVSETGRNSLCSSTAFLSRQSSVNSSNPPIQRGSGENLQKNKWFSSSSVLITRVKSMQEKFRRVVVQSVQPDEWPSPSILFLDRYHCLNGSSFESTTKQKGNFRLVKSNSIDPVAKYSKHSFKNANPAGSGWCFKRERFHRSTTSYKDSTNQSNENGITCSNMDLKAIINTFKQEDDKNGTGTSSGINHGFAKRKIIRKQVSFDDDPDMVQINRSVNVIAEEIESTRTKLEDNSFSQKQKRETEEPLENSDNVALPKEIEFDEHGQTWEIYGADPDPEILGQAIQLHLERLMTCRQVHCLPNGDVVRATTISGAKSHLPVNVLKPLRSDLQSSREALGLFARQFCVKWLCFSSGAVLSMEQSS